MRKAPSNWYKMITFSENVVYRRTFNAVRAIHSQELYAKALHVFASSSNTIVPAKL